MLRVLGRLPLMDDATVTGRQASENL